MLQEKEVIIRTATTNEGFLDPYNPDSVKETAELASDVIKAVAEIYRVNGKIEEMAPEIRDWLQNENDSRMRNLTGQILRKEAETRRFGRGFQGQIHPQHCIPGLIGQLIGSAMNTNAIVEEVSKVETGFEKDVIAWIARDIAEYDPDKAGGNIITGGTTANYCAIWAFRNSWLHNHGIDPNKIRKNKTPLYFLSSEHRHYSIDKACNSLGVRLSLVKSENYKADPGSIERHIKRIRSAGADVVGVLGIAGETETGAIEDLQAIAGVAKRYHVYSLCDGAYGAAWKLSRAKDRFKGISDFDALTFDPHKGEYVPYPAGSIVFKDKNLQLYVHPAKPGKDGKIIFKPNYLPPVAPTVEGSRGTGGIIGAYLTKEHMGNEGLARVLNHTLDLAEYAFNRTSTSDILRPLFMPELNTILIGLRPNIKKAIRQLGMEPTLVIKEIQQKIANDPHHYYYISENGNMDDDLSFEGKRDSVFRWIAMHPFTTECDVNGLFTLIEQEVTRLLAKKDVLKGMS